MIKRILKIAALAAGAVYLSALAWLTLFGSRGYYNDMPFDLYVKYTANVTPFRTMAHYLRDIVRGFPSEMWRVWIAVVNLAGNVAAFVPLGVLLPIFIKKTRKLGWLCLAAGVVSMFIETAQLAFRRGSFDVDDIILNVIGGIIGLIVFALSKWIYEHYHRMNDRREGRLNTWATKES